MQLVASLDVGTRMVYYNWPGVGRQGGIGDNIQQFFQLFLGTIYLPCVNKKLQCVSSAGLNNTERTVYTPPAYTHKIDAGCNCPSNNLTLKSTINQHFNRVMIGSIIGFLNKSHRYHVLRSLFTINRAGHALVHLPALSNEDDLRLQNLPGPHDSRLVRAY